MLVAEIHGKIVPEVQQSEDYLTSAVFGHLRYVPPRTFWRGLFARAVSNLENGPSLADLLWPDANCVADYTELQVRFWERPQELNEPDLLLYWVTNAPQGNVLTADAQLVAAFTTGKAFLLPLAEKRIGHLVLFSPAHQTVFDTATVEKLP